MCTRRWRRSIFFASCAVFGHFDKLSKVSWKSANSCLKKFYNIWQDLTLSLWRYLEQHLNLTEKWIRLWLLWNPGVNSPKILFVWLSAAPSLTGKVTVNLLLKVLCCSNRNNFLLFMNFTRFIKKYYVFQSSRRLLWPLLLALLSWASSVSLSNSFTFPSTTSLCKFWYLLLFPVVF